MKALVTIYVYVLAKDTKIQELKEVIARAVYFKQSRTAWY